MRHATLSHIMLPIAATCILAACTEKSAEQPTIKEITFIQASPDYSLASKFKNVRAVQLELTDDCIIGEIRETVSVDGKLFVLTKNEEVYCFDDKTGKFIRQIGSRGEGPGEYVNATSIFLDDDGKTLAIVDNIKNTINTYSTTDGKFISSKKPDVSFAWADRAMMSDDGYLMLSTKLTGGTPANDYGFIAIGPDGTAKHFDPFAPIKVENFAMAVSAHPMTKTDDGIRFFKFFNDTIFTFSEGQIMPYIKLNLGSEIATKEIVAQMGGDPDISMFQLRSSGYMPRFDKIYETEHLIVVVPYIYTETGYYWIDKDKTQGVHVASSNQVDQEVKWVLEGRSIINIVGSDNKRMISAFQDMTIEAFKRVMTNNKEMNIFDESVKAFFENANPEGNPCLLFYEN